LEVSYLYILKRNKRSSKSKTNTSSTKHETLTSGPVTATDVESTQKHNQLQQNKSNNNTNNNENSTMSQAVPIQKTENLNKVKENTMATSGKPSTENLNKVKENTVVASGKPSTENLNKVKENTVVASGKPPTENLKVKETTVAASSKPSSIEKPKNIVTVDPPEGTLSKQNSSAKITLQKDPSSLLAPEKQQIFEKITSPVEVTPEPPSNNVKKSVITMGRLLEPRPSQAIG